MINWEQLLREVEDLPSSPQVAARILETTAASSLLLPDLEAVLVHDPALAVKVMRLANSTLFGAAGRISTMGHAMARLDIHIAKLIALSFQLTPPAQGAEFDYEAYWRRSQFISVVAARLARHFPEVNVDEARITGLLAELGLLVLAEYRKDAAATIFAEAKRTGQPIEAVTRHYLGADHAGLAARLLHHWHFPDAIVNAIQVFPHASMIDDLDEHPRELAKVLHIASLIADYLILGNDQKLAAVHIWTEMWARLDADATTAFLGSFHDQIERLEELRHTPTLSNDELLAEARRQMVQVSLATATNLVMTARQAEETQIQVERLQKQRDMLAQQVTTDPLTGIGNRKLFDARVREEIKRCQRRHTPLALIMFDLDHFKRLNDTYGHQAGDEVLKAATRAIRGCLRASDIVVRYGGEEFIVIAPDTDMQGAEALAERMRVTLADSTIPYNGQQLGITASFGVGVANDLSRIDAVDPLVALTDKCLYEAKRAGRNCVRSDAL